MSKDKEIRSSAILPLLRIPCMPINKSRFIIAKDLIIDKNNSVSVV